MRIIVPLQGVVQGRGGVFWGSVIPCGLFYLLQLYIRQRRPSSSEEVDDQTDEVVPSADGSLSRANSSSNVNSANSDEFASLPNRQLKSPTTPPFVSKRALSALGTGDSPYYIGWTEYYQDPYHENDNPKGIIQLGLAENSLSLDLLQDWMRQYPEASLWNKGESLSLKEVAPYQYSHGMPVLKSVLSTFLESLLGRAFEIENMVLTAGATAAIEILAFCLGEAGDAFLVPSPYYSGFDRDMKWRCGIKLVPVSCPSAKGFTITRTALEKAFNQTQRAGTRVRAILITTPGNPVGKVLDAETIRSVLNFAKAKAIHVISDEIYAGSVFRGQFLSVSQILASDDYNPDFVHIVYGLSKDFGLAGFRVGVLYTTNEKILAAAQKFTRFCTVSSQTQRLLVYLLKDKDFVRRFLEENRRRLSGRHASVVNSLQMAGISSVEINGGLFCWVDLRHLLVTASQQAEINLWKKLLYDVKLNLTPGSACHCSEAGWFRLCFANVDDQTMDVALKRLHVFTDGIRK